jgi:hypothetical protein
MNTITLKLIAPALLLGALTLPAAAQTPTHPHHSINSRLHEQHERIHQGVQSDQLTRREQHRLDVRDAHIRTQEYRDRLSGGKFTSAERRHIQRELNGSSRAIYRDKHNHHVR